MVAMSDCHMLVSSIFPQGRGRKREEEVWNRGRKGSEGNGVKTRELAGDKGGGRKIIILALLPEE